MLVFDSSSLIYLAKAGKINKLEAFDEKLVVPEKVYEEVVKTGIEKGKPDAKRIDEAVGKGVFEVEETEIDGFLDRDMMLSDADRSVLKLAFEKNVTAVIDEEHGRNIADIKGIKTRGTAYIVLRMVKENVTDRSEARETIDIMIDEGWYCSTDLYKEIIKRIEGF